MLLALILSVIKMVAAALDPATVDLLTPLREYGEGCGYEACPQTKEGFLNVHIVPHTHGELGYMATFDQYYTGYDDFYVKSDVNMKRILDYTITELWSDRKRTFTLADMPYFFRWWKDRDGSVRRMVYELLRQGRLNLVGGGWGMNDEACTSYHAIIESFTYSLRKLNATFMECGRPLVAWQADVYGHSKEFTSLAAQMGFDGLFVNPISFDDELARMTRQGMEFLWRGSDDLGSETDMFTHKLFDGYWSPPGFCFSSLCSDPYIITSDSLKANAEERVDQFLESVRFRQAPNYNTSNIMVMMGQVFGYFDASLWFNNVDKLIALVNEKSCNNRKKVHLTYSTPACYLRAVHDANPILETKQDDMFPMAVDRFSYMSGMYTSRPSLKLLIREGLVYLQIAKQMQVLARLFNNDRVFEEFSWIMGVIQDHNIITGSMRDYVAKYYTEKLHHAIQRSTLLLKQAFNKLRKSKSGLIYFRCPFNISLCENIATSVMIQIYNPLAWPVTIPVRLPVDYSQYAIYDNKGKALTTALVKIPDHVLNLRNASAKHELVFIAQDIPPIGYRTYYLEELFRTKRSIIKKLKKRNKKYFIRSNNQKKPDRQTMLESSEYAYFDDDDDYYDDINGTTTVPETKIIFGNVSKSDEVNDDSDVVRPSAQTKIIFSNVTNTTNSDESEIVKPVNKVKPEDNEKEIVEDPSTEYTEPPTQSSEEVTEPNKDIEILADKYDIEIINATDKPEIGNIADEESEIQTEKQMEEFKDETEGRRKLKEERTELTEKPKTAAQMTEQFEENSENKSRTDEGSETTEKSEIKEEIKETSENVSFVEIIQANYSNSTERDDMTVTRTTETNNLTTVGKEVKGGRRLNNEWNLFIENKYVRINLDPASQKICSVILSNGLKIDLDIQFYYYASDEPDKMGRKHMRAPGAYIFRSMDSKPVPIIDYLDTKIYKNEVVEELHTGYADYASIAVRLYAEKPVIEVEWLIGPVPVDDGIGKEVFLRYMTDLTHEGIFYTDSNGRQTIKRARNLRPMYDIVNKDPVSGNYYPVTTKIYIEDLKKNIRFTVFNDRSQGGTSLYDGEVDLMIHRRILTVDSSVEDSLNETEDDMGVMVRGKHYLYLSKADYKPNKIFEKKFAKELELAPQVLVTANSPYLKETKPLWKKEVNEMSFLKNKLPLGVHLLTLEKWNDNTILLRLENYLEKSDTVRTGKKNVFIKEMFTNIVINSVRETTLAANMWLKDFVPLQWRKKEEFVSNFNEYYGSYKDVVLANGSDYVKPLDVVDLKAGITLIPQQIRTFVCEFDYVD